MDNSTGADEGNVGDAVPASSEGAQRDAPPRSASSDQHGIAATRQRLRVKPSTALVAVAAIVAVVVVTLLVARSLEAPRGSTGQTSIIWNPPQPPSTLTEGFEIRKALLDELRPVTLEDCTLRRIGSKNDGGYIMCGELLKGIEVVYSYGVGPNDEFGCHLSKLFHVPVRQYDCFDPSRPRCTGGQFDFHNECIGPQRTVIEGRKFDTLTNQIVANGDSGKRMVVKIDIEGAEWEALMATSDEVLARIDQLPMELHGADKPLMLDVIRKLKRNFYVINLNFNNVSCSIDAAPLPAWAYQVTFVNKRLTDAKEGLSARSPLNAPDNPTRPDCQVLFH